AQNAHVLVCTLRVFAAFRLARHPPETSSTACRETSVRSHPPFVPTRVRGPAGTGCCNGCNGRAAGKRRAILYGSPAGNKAAATPVRGPPRQDATGYELGRTGCRWDNLDLFAAIRRLRGIRQKPCKKPSRSLPK